MRARDEVIHLQDDNREDERGLQPSLSGTHSSAQAPPP